MSPSSTTRWCPTPEQLKILEELYRRGMKTPNASQIQRITAQLSFYGKIHGKNVFYWFQNHKARDRQKLRKKLAKQLHQQQQLLHHPHIYQCPQTQYTRTLDFQAPSAFPHQLSNCFSTENLDLQGTGGVCHEEVPEEVMMRQTWTSGLPEDCLNRSYGHDSVMIMDVGPTFPCCRNKPLETLELFPLRSTSANDQKATSSILSPPPVI